MTVRSELERLGSKGVIYRLQGRGTLVAEAKITQSVMLSSFSEDMRARGMTPGSQVLSQEVVAASDIVASNLEVAPDSAVVRIERVRTADGTPMALEHAFLPSRRFPGLEDEDLSGVSLYEVLERRYEVPVHTAVQRIGSVALDDEEAELLGTPGGQSAFLIQRVTRASDEAVIEYVRSLYRGDRYEVHTRLER